MAIIAPWREWDIKGRDEEIDFDGLFLQPFQLIPLPNVSGNGDDLGVVVILLQPGNDDRGIQAAGIGQYDLFDFLPSKNSGNFWQYCPGCCPLFALVLLIYQQSFSRSWILTYIYVLL